MNDLPSLLTHEPHTILRFRAGDKVADIDADSSPGFTGDKNYAPQILAERSGRFADLQEMLYANGKEGDHRSVLLVLQGMDTAGKGGIVTHVVGAGNPIRRSHGCSTGRLRGVVAPGTPRTTASSSFFFFFDFVGVLVAVSYPATPGTTPRSIGLGSKRMTAA